MAPKRKRSTSSSLSGNHCFQNLQSETRLPVRRSNRVLSTSSSVAITPKTTESTEGPAQKNPVKRARRRARANPSEEIADSRNNSSQSNFPASSTLQSGSSENVSGYVSSSEKDSGEGSSDCRKIPKKDRYIKRVCPTCSGAGHIMIMEGDRRSVQSPNSAEARVKPPSHDLVMTQTELHSFLDLYYRLNMMTPPDDTRSLKSRVKEQVDFVYQQGASYANLLFIEQSDSSSGDGTSSTGTSSSGGEGSSPGRDLSSGGEESSERNSSSSGGEEAGVAASSPSSGGEGEGSSSDGDSGEGSSEGDSTAASLDASSEGGGSGYEQNDVSSSSDSATKSPTMEYPFQVTGNNDQAATGMDWKDHDTHDMGMNTELEQLKSVVRDMDQKQRARMFRALNQILKLSLPDDGNSQESAKWLSILWTLGCNTVKLFKEELLSGGTPQHHRAELLQILGHDIKPQILSEITGMSRSGVLKAKKKVPLPGQQLADCPGGARVNS